MNTQTVTKRPELTKGNLMAIMQLLCPELYHIRGKYDLKARLDDCSIAESWRSFLLTLLALKDHSGYLNDEELCDMVERSLTVAKINLELAYGKEPKLETKIELRRVQVLVDLFKTGKAEIHHADASDWTISRRQSPNIPWEGNGRESAVVVFQQIEETLYLSFQQERKPF